MHDDLVHPTLRHPLTGAPLRAVGISRRGPIWPVIGAAPDGGDGGGDGRSGDGGAGGDGGSSSGSAGGAGDGGDGGFTPITSQEDFDQRLSDRLARERRKFADYADLKKKAEAHDKALEAAKSDQDKAVDAARKEGEKAAAEKANTRLVNAEVRATAATLKFRDPHDAIAQLRDDLGSVKVSDDGDVDADAVKKLLDDLAKAKPYLVDDGKGTASARDAGLGAAGNGKAAADVQPGMGRIRHAYETSGK